MKCSHPQEERWQYPQFWLCCKCYRYYWGDKRDAELRPMYAWYPEAKTRHKSG